MKHNNENPIPDTTLPRLMEHWDDNTSELLVKATEVFNNRFNDGNSLDNYEEAITMMKQITLQMETVWMMMQVQEVASRCPNCGWDIRLSNR